MSFSRPTRTSSGASTGPPGRHFHATPTGSTPGESGGQRRRVVNLGALPPPPPGVTQSQNASHRSSYSQSIAKSMTIDEMRQLHHRALNEAEAKRTELRLVLASRYRELVGSSDEVIRMKERAQELHDLAHALPSLMEKLAKPIEKKRDSNDIADEKKESEDQSNVLLRRSLSTLPRIIYRALDVNDVYQATTTLIELFTLIASQTDSYPLANALSAQPASKQDPNMDHTIKSLLRMIFLQVQTLPDKIRRIAARNLLHAASYGLDDSPSFGAQVSAAALSSLDLLDVEKKQNRATHLLETYFDSKAKLLASLLNKLTAPNPQDEGPPADTTAGNAEDILSKIVLILQYDIILHPYQIFCLRTLPCKDGYHDKKLTSTLPEFDRELVKAKCSKFLAAHLPLIRTKVKSVLVTIAGTTASALGQIRQSLYDKTDGVDCMERLDDNGICTFDEAVEGLVDVRTVLSQVDASADAAQRRFSLWSALFSNTFSSLVHSLLTTAFQSVHSKLVSTLRASLMNAPPLAAILPHEAYRNTLRIATELDESLLKVSQDAHELLVHAEEREESERRLRQSLYVQTCEIMGRLVCELRRLVYSGKQDDKSDATKEFIVGRLCFLLKFRLTSLPTLLDPKSSPAAMHATSGMISFVDMQSAFELADDNEDGLITLEEAMEAVESAFSGTQFRGAEMLRETLLLSTSTESDRKAGSDVATNITLNELALLAARGLRHEASGPLSALGTVQKSLDDIIEGCFREWAVATLADSTVTFKNSLEEFLETACSVPDIEWRRLHQPSESGQSPALASTTTAGNVSAYIVGFTLDVSSCLNRAICPLDAISPVPSMEYASSLGIMLPDGASIPTLLDTIRWNLLSQSLVSLSSSLEEALSSLAESGSKLENSGCSALVQHHIDVSFIRWCFFKRNHYGFGSKGMSADVAAADQTIDGILARSEKLLGKACDRTTLSNLPSEIEETHKYVFAVSDLSLSSLLGEDSSAGVSAAGELDLGAGSLTSTPLFRAPLSSSTRFVLLPVQADRSLSEIQMRGKFKEKEASTSRPETASGNVVSSGLGFLSSMLKKN